MYIDENGGGTTYLPIASLAKILDEKILWNQERKSVYIGETHFQEVDETIAEIANRWLVDGDYPRTANGESYGSELCASLTGYLPDLTSALATNGKQGYLRYEDTYSVPQEEENEEPYCIPVYDLEGNQIGEFQIANGE